MHIGALVADAAAALVAAEFDSHATRTGMSGGSGGFDFCICDDDVAASAFVICSSVCSSLESMVRSTVDTAAALMDCERHAIECIYVPDATPSRRDGVDDGADELSDVARAIVRYSARLMRFAKSHRSFSA